MENNLLLIIIAIEIIILIFIFLFFKKVKENKELKNAKDEILNNLNNFARQSNNNTNLMQQIITDSLGNRVDKMSDRQSDILARMEREIREDLNTNLDKINKTTETRLNDMQRNVNEKLDSALNERLESNFSKIAEKLAELYKSLGELNKMSADINDLNRTLSNVKTRGTWGEAQLRDIIRETMTPSQYEENIATKKGSSDIVEFAIKIPSKNDNDDYILLPIDSKFPMDIYAKLVDASSSNNPDAIDKTTKELERRIKEEAKKIQDKYIAIPDTTNFAIMYLPTESLYAEVLSINGLAEFCQTNYHIMLAGPTTITALLNSLRVGFQNLTLTKKTQEVERLLLAIQQQFDVLDNDILKASKNIDLAKKANDELLKRTNIIRKKMKNISGEIDYEEANTLLGVND